MSSQDSVMIFILIAGGIAAVGLFIVLRALVWWYWGITDHLANQRRIIALLEQLTATQPAPPPRTQNNPLTGKPPNAR